MSDFFDNEDELEKEPSEEPADKPEKVKKKDKPAKKSAFGGIFKIIIYVVCVAIVAVSCFLVVKFIPKNEDNSDTGSSTASDKIQVVNVELNDVDTVTVKNKKGLLKIYGETLNSEKKWYVDGVKKELISDSISSYLVSTATSVSATKKIDKMSAADCGLVDPYLTVEIGKSDGSAVNYAIGKDANIGDGCYFKLDGEDNIYLIESTVKDELDVEALDLADADMMPAVSVTDSTKDYFENGTLQSFDSITVTGKNYAKPLKIVENDDGQISEYIKYKVISPDEHLADKIDDLYQLFSNGVNSDGAYSFYAADLAKFGLDKPDISISMQMKNQVNTLRFSLQSDGNYAGWCNSSELIYKISPSIIETVAKSKATDYYSRLVCLYSIDELSGLTIKTNDKEYSFRIEANPDTESEDKYKIYYGGKNIDCKSFQNLYEYVVSLSSDDFETKDAVLSEKMILEFRFNNGTTQTLEFVRVNETKYRYSINGKPMGRVSSSKISKIIKNAGKLANGEKLSELN